MLVTTRQELIEDEQVIIKLPADEWYPSVNEDIADKFTSPKAVFIFLVVVAILGSAIEIFL